MGGGGAGGVCFLWEDRWRRVLNSRTVPAETTLLSRLFHSRIVCVCVCVCVCEYIDQFSGCNTVRSVYQLRKQQLGGNQRQPSAAVP